jgi:hypothetical protein
MCSEGRWEYRDFGNYGASHHIGGDQQRKGAYFRFESTIVTGGFLDKIEDVIYVVARNTGTNKRYFLHYDPYVWIGTFMDSWFLFVQPADWMFQDDWVFILAYNGSDAQIHLQFVMEPAPPAAFPVQPSHINVTKSPDSFIISWSGIGDPNTQPSINYKVRVFEAGEKNWIVDILGDWEGGGTLVTGTYDATLNKVTFAVPGAYGGEAYGIRLENMLPGNRSSYYMILQPFSP